MLHTSRLESVNREGIRFKNKGRKRELVKRERTWQEKKLHPQQTSLPLSLSFIVSDKDFVSSGISSGMYCALASFSFSIARMHSFTVDDLNLSREKKKKKARQKTQKVHTIRRNIHNATWENVAFMY